MGANHPTNSIIKFADDTTVVGLIKDGDEAAYRDEVQRMVKKCSTNNLSLNTGKMKDMIMDFSRPAPAPLYINGVSMERVPHFKFLGAHISEDLSWSANTTAAVKKAQQRLHFLRILRRNNLEEKLLVTFYRSTMERMLAYAITVWYAGTLQQTRRGSRGSSGQQRKSLAAPSPPWMR